MKQPFVVSTYAAGKRSRHIWSNRYFNRQDCERVMALGDALPQEDAVVGNSAKLRSEIRTASIGWIESNAASAWLLEKLGAVITEWNAAHFGLDVYGFFERLQYTTYGVTGSHYDWHVDYGNNVHQRKLSLSLLLSDPKDYDGGELELWAGGSPVTVPRVQGMLVAFPSYTMHRVTPVTRGVRKVLVAWVNGPDFR